MLKSIFQAELKVSNFLGEFAARMELSGIGFPAEELQMAKIILEQFFVREFARRGLDFLGLFEKRSDIK